METSPKLIHGRPTIGSWLVKWLLTTRPNQQEHRVRDAITTETMFFQPDSMTICSMWMTNLARRKSSRSTMETMPWSKHKNIARGKDYRRVISNRLGSSCRQTQAISQPASKIRWRQSQSSSNRFRWLSVWNLSESVMLRVSRQNYSSSTKELRKGLSLTLQTKHTSRGTSCLI